MHGKLKNTILFNSKLDNDNLITLFCRELNICKLGARIWTL